MQLVHIQQKAEELSQQYNPEGYAPFPYKRLVENCGDLKIFLTDRLPDNHSGVISYVKDTNSFVILINQTKPETRQNFTTAHELGHYFLHQDKLKQENTFVDGELYRLDNAEFSPIESEANNFAATLVMPEKFVLKAWKALENIERCADVFKVSASAISIRLEKLGLLKK